MKKIISITLLFSSLIAQANVSNMVVPMLVPVVCKVAESLTKDLNNPTVTNLLSSAAEGSTGSVLLNTRTLLQKPVELKELLLDGVINTGFVVAEKALGNNVQNNLVKEATSNSLYRTALACLCNVLVKQVYSNLTTTTVVAVKVVKK